MTTGCDVLPVESPAIKPKGFFSSDISRRGEQKLPVLDNFLWQRIFTFLEPSKSIPAVNRSFRKNYVDLIRPKVESVLQSENWARIAELLPLFRTMPLPKKTSRLNAPELVATYYHLHAIAKRILKTLPGEEKKPFEGKSPHVVVEDPKTFLDLLVQAKMYGIGAFCGGSTGSVVETGGWLKSFLSLDLYPFKRP